MTSAASVHTRRPSRLHNSTMFIADMESSACEDVPSSSSSSSSSSSTADSPKTPTSAIMSPSDGESDSSETTPNKKKSSTFARGESTLHPEPVFSTIPTRRVQSSSAMYKSGNVGQMTFPVSRPIRPFDSISNAMGTAPKRVSPPLSRAESFGAVSGEENKQQQQQLSMKPKGLSVQTTGLETGKQKRSNVLLEPPKNNRFQNGFFILDMTQDEFKTRAW
ncbi:hypothetical protein M408DRAFT_126273 [Serendipita vermifera MAFF 305830]|uniref:Uncharacterized protein n=1 Tax=Serendipita vermifera MAFF 305830 TaxID=933852 RepID=A0A0C3AWT3_SERVB|nr:hypothetical protein M408DRAFT_126273 [Serendipita vermifera MAFF 305830]